MTLNQLKYFCETARLHSVTKASNELYVTQPTISLAIKELEKEFNIVLITRTGNCIELTDDGEKFYEKANNLIQHSSELRSEFLRYGLKKQPLKIGIPPMLSTLFFPGLYTVFKEEYPDIPIILEEYGSFRAANLVEDGSLDLALANMEIFNIDKFDSCILSNDHLVYCVYKTHPKFNYDVISLKDFSDENILLFNADSVHNQILKTRFDIEKVEPNIIMRSSQLYTTLQFVREGNSGCFLFSDMITKFPDFKGIPVEPFIESKIGIIWRKGNYIKNDAKTFIEFTKNNYDSIVNTKTARI